METIRVALNDTFQQTYELVSPSGVDVQLTTAATVEVAVLNVDTGAEITMISATLVSSPTPSNVVGFSVEDATITAGMYKIQFKITNVDGTVTTYPVEGEQGFLVY